MVSLRGSGAGRRKENKVSRVRRDLMGARPGSSTGMCPSEKPLSHKNVVTAAS